MFFEMEDSMKTSEQQKPLFPEDPPKLLKWAGPAFAAAWWLIKLIRNLLA